MFDAIPRNADSRRIPLPGRILVAHQAEFLPWLGFVSKAAMGDLFIILDDTQFKKKYFENRNKIRFPNEAGWIWLNAGVKSPGGFQNMMRVEFDNLNWVEKHLRTIHLSYSRTRYFKQIFPEIEHLYRSTVSKKLIDFNVRLISYAFQKFSIGVPVFRVSDMARKGIPLSGQSTDLVLSMCKAVRADVLVAGKSGKDYLDGDRFKAENITLVFQEFTHPVYAQYHGSFLPFMSFFDILFNHGAEKSREILGQSAVSFWKG